MKKILNKLFTGSLLACMVLVSSCAGDYLDTAPTDSTGASDAVGTTANAMKALNGIAKIMTTQQYYFGQGFAGENNIMAHYENYPRPIKPIVFIVVFASFQVTLFVTVKIRNSYMIS